MPKRKIPITAHRIADTWIDREEECTDYGQFRRGAIARHKDTGELVVCRCDIADTYFSIPATTKTQHGYITSTELGYEFRPHTDQSKSPAEFRKSVKKAYK